MGFPSRNPGTTVVNGSLQIPPGFPKMPEEVRRRFPEIEKYEREVSQWYASIFQSLSESNRQIETSISQNFDAIARLGGLMRDIRTEDETGVTLGAARFNATEGFQVEGVQVVGPQGAAVADATGVGDVVAQLNALLAELRTHGLIAP